MLRRDTRGCEPKGRALAKLKRSLGTAITDEQKLRILIAHVLKDSVVPVQKQYATLGAEGEQAN